MLHVDLHVGIQLAHIQHPLKTKLIQRSGTQTGSAQVGGAHNKLAVGLGVVVVSTPVKAVDVGIVVGVVVVPVIRRHWIGIRVCPGVRGIIAILAVVTIDHDGLLRNGRFWKRRQQQSTGNDHEDHAADGLKGVRQLHYERSLVSDDY